MLVSAAVCPHPPLLVPALGGATAALDELRAASDTAVGRLAGSRPDLTVVVGPDERTGTYDTAASGTLRPYGPDITVGPPGAPVLPLSLTLGRWLLERHGPHHRPLLFAGVAPGAPPAECLRLGAALTDRGDRVALLVMGDGAACHGLKSPGYHDDRAAPFDAVVATALAAADAGTLAALDPGVATSLLAAGRPAWQVLAGAATGHSYVGDLLTYQHPYGVGYFVATWT